MRLRQIYSKTLLFVILIGCTSGQQQKTGYVFDFEQILTQEQEDQLHKIIVAHEKNTTNEIAVVTTPDWGDQEDILLYSVDFGEKYGVGKEEKDNGVVIVFSQAMRRTRISTGYGTEHILKDEIAKRIIDSVMIPAFKNGEYFDGIFAGTKAVIDFLEKPENQIKPSTNKNKAH